MDLLGKFAILIPVSIALSSQLAAGGGFPFDPTRCPERGWVPNEEVSPIATKAVCAFVTALDRGDYATAYKMTGAEFKYLNSLDRFTQYIAEIRPKFGQIPGTNPERSVTDETLITEDPAKLFRFTFEVLYPNLSLKEDLYVREDRGTAEIVLFKIGPN